jgi:hypothetical protein
MIGPAAHQEIAGAVIPAIVNAAVAPMPTRL